MTEGHVISLAAVQRPPSEITQPILIGKDILDLVTGAMYLDPLCIYREYIQNAADSFTIARQEGREIEGGRPRVDIAIDGQARSVTLRDNGLGVPQAEFVSRLTAIGASRKKGMDLRGFRGVGRLSGLGYCQELLFRSRAKGDARVSQISWDGRRLKELLRDGDSTPDLTSAIRSIARTSILSGDQFPSSFFEVELRKVARVRNDVLLNVEEIGSYLSQVAPVPFDPAFSFGEAISSFLKQHVGDDGIDIYVNGSKAPICRPHCDEFPVTDKISDQITGVDLIEIPGLESGIDAVGWTLSHSYLGSIPKRTRFDGLRIRAGNIQVGSSDVAAQVFVEPRFNGWCVGEFYVLNKKIVPNGRRDDFEINAHYQNFLGHLGGIAKQITKVCREKSELRNRLKQSALLIDGIAYNISILEDSKYASAHGFIGPRTAQQLTRLQALVAAEGISGDEREFLARKLNGLQVRFSKLGKKGKKLGIFDKVAPAKRRAYEDAITVILDAPLPMEAKANLIQSLGARVASSLLKKKK